MITPSAILPTSAACAARADPEADRDRGLPRVGLGRGDQVGQRGRDLGPLAGRPHGGDDVDEAAGHLADLACAARARWSGRRSGTIARPAVGERLADRLVLAQRQVGDDRPRGARRPRQLGELGRRRRAPAPCSRRPSAPPGPGRQPLRRSPARCAASPPRPAPGCPRRGSSARRRADPRKERRARSGRRPRRRRPRRPPARTRGRGTRPSCTASAPRAPRPSRRQRRRRSVPRRRSLAARPARGPRPGPCRRGRRGRARRSRRPARVLQQPGDRVRGLQRGNDPLQREPAREGARGPGRQ